MEYENIQVGETISEKYFVFIIALKKNSIIITMIIDINMYSLLYCVIRVYRPILSHDGKIVAFFVLLSLFDYYPKILN